MKVNLKKVKPVELINTNLSFKIEGADEPGCLRSIEIYISENWPPTQIANMYHEDAYKLLDWLNRVLP